MKLLFFSRVLKMCASPHRVIVVTPFVNNYALPTMSFVKKNPPDSSLLLLGTGFLSLKESNLQLRPPLIGDHLLKATTSPKHQNSPSQITSVGTSLVLSSRKRSRDAGSDLYNATFPESYTLLRVYREGLVST